mgnify:CR=1 FL=1
MRYYKNAAAALLFLILNIISIFVTKIIFENINQFRNEAFLSAFMIVGIVFLSIMFTCLILYNFYLSVKVLKAADNLNLKRWYFEKDKWKEYIKFETKKRIKDMFKIFLRIIIIIFFTIIFYLIIENYANVKTKEKFTVTIIILLILRYLIFFILLPGYYFFELQI